MNKSYKLTLFIFRRDLRLTDNTALIAAQKQSDQVIVCFIFDPRQIGEHNSYKSNNSVQFMLESLADLQGQIQKQQGRLLFFYGKAEDVVQELLQQLPIESIFCNDDYTLFSKKRDAAIAKICTRYNRDFVTFDDTLLNAPDTIKNKQNAAYTIFTPFYKRSLEESIKKPEKTIFHFYMHSVSVASLTTLEEQKKNIFYNTAIIKGGTQEAHKLLHRLSQQKEYATTRDFPALPTTHLSAHLKFGTISVREAYYAIHKTLGAGHPLLRQLYWRDFYTYIAYHFPHVFGHAFHKKYDDLPWSTNKEHFTRWCTGATGFPIVDAGMRELNVTGFMHNRVRMIVASFLVKDLHINWQWGEKYFAQQLVDYDPSVNNGNWQWAASTGCDPQPYFRIFNPWLQQKKFDPECEYIKKWVPELRTVTPKEIHAWHKSIKPHNNYPTPIVHHTHEAVLAKSYFKNAA